MNNFTPGPVTVVAKDDHFSVERDPTLKVCRSYGNSLADEEDSFFIAAAFNAATTHAEQGYDAQKCVERLPEILAALQLAHAHLIVDGQTVPAIDAALSTLRPQGDTSDVG